MGQTDQTNERRRFYELYSGMSDHQIESMSKQMGDFNEIAQEVLRAEMSRRGLNPQRSVSLPGDVEAARKALLEAKAQQDGTRHRNSDDGPADPEEANILPDDYNEVLQDRMPGFDPAAFDLVAIWQVSSAEFARKIMDLLNSAGIEAYLGPENVESVDEYHGGYEDGVEIKVMKFRAKIAVEGLRNAFPPEPGADSEEAVEFVAYCPKCKSPDIIFQGVDAEPGKAATEDAKFNWSCDACGHEWKDDGVEQAEP